ncbi:hypothetical protein ABBQ32_001974 [Trebouxia sp. C0010 RCD-2024]
MADLEADLFGEESDEDNAEQNRKDRKSKAFQQPARRLGDDDDMESDEDEQPQRHQRPIGPPLQLNAELVDLPARDSIRLVRLSNILGLESQPYDPSTFQVSQEYYTDTQGTRRIKLTNQLRWREVVDDEGQPARQSNARFVQWEDGTWQLLLGDEVLDVKELDMQQDNSFLFVRHQGVIQGQASLETKIALQPASLNSRLHTRLTAAVDKRHTKVHKVRHTATVSNPSKQKDHQAKMEEERIRGAATLQKKQRREMGKYKLPPAHARHTGGMTTHYLEAVEAESDYEDDGLTASDRARRSLHRDRFDEEAEAEAERRLGQAKRAAPAGRPGPSPAKRQRVAALSSDEELSDQDGDPESNADPGISEEEEELRPPAESRQKPKARRGIIIEDDDD